MIDETLHEAESKMGKTLDSVREELGSIRTGRVSPGLLQKLQVEYYGTSTPLQQLASVSAPEARLLVVTPYDRSVIGAIEKAVQYSDLGVNPSNDGQVIRLPFPALTEDRRRDLVKLTRTRGEDAKVSVRNIRRHAKEALERAEKNGEISQDELRRAEGRLQAITDQHVSDVDGMLQRKEQEIMEV